MGTSRETSSLRPLLVASLPKSGTIRCRTFFHVFSELLRGNLEATALGTTASGEIPCESLCAGFYVEHSVYMDLEFLEFPAFERWRELPLGDESYNNGFGLCKGLYDGEKQIGRTPKIVHLYRNPFDQAISIFNNKCALKDIQAEGGYRDASGVFRKLNLSELFRELYLPDWIKIHYPYKIAQVVRPDEVRVLSYEKLMADPVGCFTEMLEFFDLSLTPEQHRLIAEAVGRTEKEKIRQIEDEHGVSFLDIGQENQQLDSAWRHVRSGQVGQWREELNEAEVDFSAALLAKYDITLDSISDP